MSEEKNSGLKHAIAAAKTEDAGKVVASFMSLLRKGSVDAFASYRAPETEAFRPAIHSYIERHYNNKRLIEATFTRKIPDLVASHVVNEKQFSSLDEDSKKQLTALVKRTVSDNLHQLQAAFPTTLNVIDDGHDIALGRKIAARIQCAGTSLPKQALEGITKETTAVIRDYTKPKQEAATQKDRAQMPSTEGYVALSSGEPSRGGR